MSKKKGAAAFQIEVDSLDAQQLRTLAHGAGVEEADIIEGIVKLYLRGERLDTGLVELGDQVVKLVQAYQAGKRRPAGPVPQVEVFRDLRAQGLSYTAIGARFGVHRTTVQRALRH
jgi:hypothetical protein